jgi:SNF2 family DNA or RNA helicase
MLGFDIIQFSKKIKDKKKEIYNENNINKSKIIIVSWAKVIETCEIERLFGKDKKFVVICDEAHAMQTLKSQRTQAVLGLCLSKNCIGTTLATGTPMKNGRPSNIFPLLVAIRHSVSKNKIEFEKKYCNAKKTRFCIWDISGASNLTELRSNE